MTLLVGNPSATVRMSYLVKMKAAICLNAGRRTVMFQEFLKCKIARTHVKRMECSSTDCCLKVSD